MTWRTAISLLVALGLGTLVTVAWLFLRDHEREHHAKILESESYATRSRLARELAVQFDALHSVARFWSTYGHLPADQWSDDAKIELGHFQGFEAVLWSDPASGVRYAATADEGLNLDRIPDDAAWETLAPLLEGFPDSDASAVAGPERQEDGRITYRVRIPVRGLIASGVLVAQINASAQLEQQLLDHSPGHAISVTWNDLELYSRGEAAEDAPESWVHSGMIELPIGGLWNVRHTPAPELVDALGRPTLPGLLIAGWMIAALMGGLIYQVGRTQARAVAAENAEARFARLNAELEIRVAERTAELAERNADLETINQSVSHDIRNPLSTIALSATFVRQVAADSDAAEALERIERANAQIGEVVERLNAYSTVAFVSLNRERVDMQSTAEDVVRQVRHSLPDLAAGMEIDVGALPPCLAQPTLVEILWYNLISNALKFSAGCPAPRLEIGVEPGTRPAVYRVRDNGVGFDSGQSEEIFKPFARLNGNRDGQGLGLAIVARVVRRHGGRIWTQSSPGEGAAFYFELGHESIVDEPGDSMPRWKPDTPAPVPASQRSGERSA